MRRWRIIGPVWIVLAALSVGWAEEVQRNTALRSGPGAFYPVVERLRAGQSVAIEKASGNWMAAQTAVTNGWLPRVALAAPRRGVDYAGLLAADDAVNVSSVDIAAATKGAFAASYEDRHGVDLAAAQHLDAWSVPPRLVNDLARSLTPARYGWVANRLPRRSFENSIILSREAERLLGQAMVAHVAQAGFVEDRSLSDYVNAVAMQVGAHTERYDCPYRVAIMDDDSVNGFGLPGGYILISKGYLHQLENEAELACVIAHEMAHISLFHGLREFKKREIHRRRDAVFAELDAVSGGSSTDAIEADLNRLADTSYLKIIGGRAREDELEADLYGAAYAAAAGYDPQAMIDMLQRVGSASQRDAFRHHPEIEERIEALSSAIRRYKMSRSDPKRLEERYAMMTGSRAQASDRTEATRP